MNTPIPVSSKSKVCLGLPAVGGPPRSMIGRERPGSAQSIIESGCANSASLNEPGRGCACGQISTVRTVRCGSVRIARHRKEAIRIAENRLRLEVHVSGFF
jgi:hypothetical protein